MDAPTPEGPAAEDCTRLLEALPDTLADLPRRPVTPRSAPAAAWGDPAIVLRCGVPEPAGLDDYASCHRAEGVDWYIPEEQVADPATDLVMTTVGRSTDVEITVPAQHRPPAAAMVDVAPAVTATLRAVDPCL